MVYVVLVLLGLAFGSFTNAFVWRLHKQEAVKGKGQRAKGKRQAVADSRFSILKGRSMCPYCEHTLSVADLIPVVSWLLLKGKCRYCHRRISLQYPVIELLTAGLFILSYHVWPYEFDLRGDILLVAWLLLLIGLISLVLYDFKWMLLPDKLVYPLLIFWSLVTVFVSIMGDNVWGTLLGAALGALMCGGVFWVLFQVSNGRWIGGGDVKLGFMLGLLVGGPLKAFMVIFGASLLGTLIVLPLLAVKRLERSSRIPFGPLLIAAAILVFLCGPYFVDILARNFLFI
jgi:prepilin signal peptidase PulO-like enzyme (type II secretory pathway)